MGGVGETLGETVKHFNAVFVNNKNGRQFCYAVWGMVAAFGALGIAAAAALNVGSAAATSHPRVGAGVRYGTPGVRSGANRRRSGTFILTLVRAIRMTGKCFVHRRPGSLVSALVLARRFERFKR